MMQKMDNNAKDNATTQTMGDNADDNAAAAELIP